jgi:predicted N-acetyltransferase YhbS/anti-sigma regulatory factor (Ser/Thr protein kinase)
MQASLTIASDERLLGLAHTFGREFAVAAGVPEGECATLVGALDEALRFVCRRAYPDDPSGRIELTLAVAERGLRASLHDWGRPLTSAEGTDVRLDLGEPVEDLRLINLGAQGKRLSFLWRTSHTGDVAGGAADPPAVAVTGVDADAIVVRAATPADAEQIAQVLYENYSLSYVHPDFYRPRWVREELLAGRVLSSVAEHGGEVVGHHALLPVPDGPAAETGVAVVAPAYRGLGLFGRLSDHTLGRADALGLEAVYGRAVTMHPYSQRAELAHGYVETAVCLAGSPGQITMRGLATGADAGKRTALMVSFLPLRRSPRSASLPARYRDQLLATYAALGLPAPAPAGAPANGPGAIHVARDPEVATTEMTISGWDDDLAAEALATLRLVLAEHCDVIYADLDLAAGADLDDAVEFLRDKGFSYAGLWPHGPGDHDHLRLQRLNCTAVDLDGIATASPRGDDLVRYVLADLEHVAA